MSEITKKRFKKLVKKYGEQEIRSKLLESGAKKTIVNYWISGDRSPSADGIYLICKAFPEVSANWLLGLQDVRSKNPDIISIHDYIGFSDESIKALNFIFKLPEDNPSRQKIYRFLNRELEDIWEGISSHLKGRKKIFPDKNKTELINDIDSLFELFEDYICGSGKTGYNEDIPVLKDDIFRRITLDKIEARLDHISEEAGIAHETYIRTEAIEWIKKRFIDAKEQGKDFNREDCEAALREFEKDYYDEDSDEGIEPGSIDLDFDDVLRRIIEEDN